MNNFATSTYQRRPVQGAASSTGSWTAAEDQVPIGPLCRAAMQAIEISGFGFILAGAGAEVRFVSPTAERQLRELPLKIVEGEIVGGNELDTRRLQAAIRWVSEVRGGESRPLRLSISGKPTACQIIVSPIPNETGEQDPAFVLVLLGQECWPGSGASADAPDLTHAELRLLGALLRGERLAAYARNAGVKMTTVKTHLQSLFDKTGQRRQSDLIRHALSDPLLRRALPNPTASTETPVRR